MMRNPTTTGSGRRGRCRRGSLLPHSLAVVASLLLASCSPADEAEARGEAEAQAGESKTTPVMIESAEHLERVLAEGRVLVDFYADWCGPCRAMTPVLNTLADERSDSLVVAKVNVDKHRGLARKYGVRGIPLLVLHEDGSEIDRAAGYRDDEALTRWLDRDR